LSKLSEFEDDLAGWSIDQRYAANDEFKPASLDNHFKGVKNVMATLEKADFDEGPK